MLRPALLLAPTLLVAGCARDTTSYPSLAPRAVERVGFAEPAPKPLAVAAPDPALDRRIADLDAQLKALTEGFARDAASAGRLAGAARGRAVGSEPWLDAQAALAGLDDWRAQSSSLVTDVEALAIERAATLAPPYPALTSLAERAGAEAERQSAAIARLADMLPAA